MYKVIIGRIVEKAMEKLPNAIYPRVRAAVLDLANNPRPFGYKKLKGRDGYRIKISDYRVIYDIEDKILIVRIIDLGHRKDIYD